MICIIFKRMVNLNIFKVFKKEKRKNIKKQGILIFRSNQKYVIR